MFKRILALFISVLSIALSLGTISVPVMAEGNADVKVFGLFSDTHDAVRTKSDGSIVGKSNGGIEMVMADIFARTGATVDNPESLDGVIMAGDIVYMSGDGKGYMADGDDTAYDTWASNPYVQAVKNAGKIVYAMGNHEFPLQATDTTTVDNCRRLFKSRTGLDPEHVKVLGGYTFISAGAEDYTPGTYKGRENWMRTEIEKALNDGTNKPIFLVLHHPMADSFYDTADEGYNSGVYSNEFKSFVMSQPRLVVISGHVHTPAANPQTIRQIENGCTFIQTPRVSGGNGVSDPYADAEGEFASDALMMEISSDNVVTIKRFHTNGSGGIDLGQDWVLDIPAMVNNAYGSYRYTDSRFNESIAPYFSADAVGRVSGITPNSAVITFPAAQAGDSSENSQIQYYKYSVTDMNNSASVKEEILLSDFYKPDSQQSSKLKYSVMGLSGDTKYRVAITPITAFFKEGSQPLYVDFTTQKEATYIGDKITMKLDAMGTNVIETDILREKNATNNYGTNYDTSWAISNGYLTLNFNVTDPGVYRFTSKLASVGCIGEMVIINNISQNILDTVTADVTTGGFGTANENFYWTDVSLMAGTYAVKVSRPSGEPLRLWNVTIGKIADISEEESGYYDKGGEDYYDEYIDYNEKPQEIKRLFTDVCDDDWFYENVKYVVDNKLMNGVSKDEFAPHNTLTRAMLVTVLYRNAGQPTVNKSIPFDDVDMGSYYADAVVWAKQNGIVNGVSETRFAPDANITREQIATIIHRYAQYKGYDVSVGENTNIFSYDDASNISDYAVSSMKYVVGSALMKGKTNTTLNPLDNATRAEIAAILQRFIKN